MTDFLALPLLSLLLFLIAGILIGYLFWYPDRAGQRTKLAELESRYWKARTAARQRKSRYRDLHRLSQAQQVDINHLRLEYESLWVKHVDADNRLAKTKRELAMLRNEKQPLDDALVAEQKRSENVVRQLQELLKSNAELEKREQRQATEISQLKHLILAFQKSSEQSQTELDLQVEVVREHRETIDRLQQNSTVRLEADPNKQDADRQLELQNKLHDTVDKLNRTQRDLAARCADLDYLRDERDSLNDQVKQAQQQSKIFETELARVGNVIREQDEIANQTQ
jgi:chromosome segregation ATPase